MLILRLLWESMVQGRHCRRKRRGGLPKYPRTARVWSGNQQVSLTDPKKCLKSRASLFIFLILLTRFFTSIRKMLFFVIEESLNNEQHEIYSDDIKMRCIIKVLFLQMGLLLLSHRNRYISIKNAYQINI